jgi:hypothetical protein
MQEYWLMVDGQSAGTIHEESVLSALASTMHVLALTYADTLTIIDEAHSTQTAFYGVIRDNGAITFEKYHEMHYPEAYGKHDGFKVNAWHPYYTFHCDSPNYAGRHRTCFREQKTDFMALDSSNIYSIVQSMCEKHAREYCQWLGIPYNGEEVIYLESLHSEGEDSELAEA